MLVGIDVCHKGKQSTIGFCATYDPNMCKYYAQASSQPVKGQEIISSTILSSVSLQVLMVVTLLHPELATELYLFFKPALSPSLEVASVTLLKFL